MHLDQLIGCVAYFDLDDASCIFPTKYQYVAVHSFGFPRQAAKIFPQFKLVWLAEETKKHLPLELDFIHEGKNAEKVAQQLKCFEWVKVCTRKTHTSFSVPRYPKGEIYLVKD